VQLSIEIVPNFYQVVGQVNLPDLVVGGEELGDALDAVVGQGVVRKAERL